MIIRAVDHHPQQNVLTRSHAEWRHQRFQGTEADSTEPPTVPNDFCNSLTDSRFPRTMVEAFGPYTSPVIDEAPQPMTLGDLGYAVLLVAALAAVGVILAWRG